MKSLDETRDLRPPVEPQPAEELSDIELEAIAAGGTKQPSSGRGRNSRPPLLTGFSPNVP